MHKYFRFLAVLTALLTLGYFFLVRTVMPQYLQQLIPIAEELSQEYINGSVKLGQIKWQGGLELQLHNVQVLDKEQQLVADVPELTVELRPWRGIEEPARALGSINLLRPQAYVRLDKNGSWNVDSLLKPSDSSSTPFYGLLRIKDGTLHVEIPEGTWQLGVNAEVDGAGNPSFMLRGELQHGEESLSIFGVSDLNDSCRLHFKTEGVDLAPFAKLAQHYGDVQELQGGLGSTSLLFVREQGKNSFSGKASLNKLCLKPAQLEGSSVYLEGTIEANDNLLTTKDFSLGFNEERVQLQAEADLRYGEHSIVRGELQAAKLSHGGYSLEQVSFPFYVDSSVIQLKGLQAKYGEGWIKGELTYTWAEQQLSSVLELDDIAITPAGRPLDTFKVEGSVAVNAAQNKDNGLWQVRAAAEGLALQWRNLLIERLTVAGSYDGKALQLDNFTAWSHGGSLAASGSITNQGQLDMQARMAEFPINPFLDLIGLDHNGSGLCSTGFKLGGTVDAPQFEGVFQLHNTELFKQRFQEAHGNVRLENNLLELSNFVAYMDQGRHMLSGTIDIRGQEPVFDLALETENVRLEPLMELVAPEVSLTGNLYNLMQLRGSLDKLYIYGEIDARDGSAVGNLYSSITGRYIYDAGQVSLEHFRVDAFYGSVLLDGTMSREQELDFAMEATGVDMAHLPLSDKDVSLEGLLNAQGALQGTLQQPHFNGQVDCDRMLINGEALTEIHGSLVGNGREKNYLELEFKQPYKERPAEYGIYSAQLELDVPQRYLHGQVLTMYGDIGGVLRMCRQDYAVQGLMDGVIDICPRGLGSGVDFKIKADNVKVHDLNYHQLAFRGRFHKYVLYFDDVRLQERADASSGLITIGGKVDTVEQQLDLRLVSKGANPALVTAFMKEPPEIKGSMDTELHIDGSFDNPHGECVMTILNGSVAGVGMDRADLELELENDNLQLERLDLSKGIYGVSASGNVPLDLFRSRDTRRNPKAEMDIVLDLDRARLGILPALSKLVKDASGETKGQLHLQGTLEEPLVYGSVKINDGQVQIDDVDTIINNIKLDMSFNGNRVEMHEMSAQLGRGRLSLDGTYALRTEAKDTYRLHVVAQDAEIASPILNGRFNCDMELVPQSYLLFAEDGRASVDYRPLIKGNVRLDDIMLNMPTIPEMGEGSSNYGLDLSLELGPKIHLYNSYLYDIWLAGGLQLKGSTRFPVIEGSIRADRGSITYLRTPFKLEYASLVWIDPGSFLPNVSLSSKARFARYNIFMRVNGPVEEMDLQLTSDPPLERNTLVRMLTLQRDSSMSDEVTSEDINNLMTAGLQMTVLGDVEMLVKQTLGLDQFRIYTGRVRAGIGYEANRTTREKGRELTEEEKTQYNVLVSKYLGERFMVGYSTSFNAIDRSYFGQYDIGRHTNLTYTRTQELDNEPEHWYGIEYRVTF